MYLCVCGTCVCAHVLCVCILICLYVRVCSIVAAHIWVPVLELLA